MNSIATLWGFAEATLFFIVPDVWLTAIAVWSPRKALIACLFALFGALAGGALMYGWGAVEPTTALATLDRIPAINAEMLATVASEIRERGLLAPFVGPIRGVPYKIYAVQAPAQEIGVGAFLLISIPARLSRFVLLTFVTRILFSKFLATWTPRRQLFLLGCCWVTFYTTYFLAMPD